LRRPSRARRLSLTSLIDAIFLLLLFFMLSSTFTRFAEIDLATGGPGADVTARTPPAFLRLSPDALDLNGAPVTLAGLPDALAALAEGDAGDAAALPVLVAPRDGVDAQRLTDLLAALRPVSGLRLTVLEAS
jgi:biopolymer transport protein ExbD